MSLQALNDLNKVQLAALLARCCGSSRWVEEMQSLFPFADKALLFKYAASVWYGCDESDWKEAFTHHPAIGDMASLEKKFAATADWAAGEQVAVKQSSQQVLAALSEANQLYKRKFGYLFIVCATGKSAEEILKLLKGRLNNQPEDEIKIAMEEQHKITILRLEKLLTP